MAKRKKSPKVPALDLPTFVKTSLCDPKNPQHCGLCLQAVFFIIGSAPGNRTSKLDSTSMGLAKDVAFWRVLYTFLFLPRSDEEVEALLQRLSHCSCDSSLQKLHDLGSNMKSDIEHAFTDALAAAEQKHMYKNGRTAFLAQAFKMLIVRLSDSGVTSVAKGILQNWPTTPLDLVPFGADSLVHTLLQWFRFFPDSIIFGLAARIIRICRFVLIQSLGTFKFSHQAILRLKEDIEWIEPHIHASPQDNFVLNALFTRFNWDIYHILEFFTVIYDEMPNDTRATTLAGFETKAMQVFSLVVYISTNPNAARRISSNSISQLCAQFCQDIFRFFHMHLYPHPDFPVHPKVVAIDHAEFPPPASLRSVPNVVVFLLKEFHRSTRCASYGCLGSIQSTGNSFQRCSRCQIVCYCSRECQIRAWKEEKYPHKRICPYMRLLIDAAGGLDAFTSKPDPSLALYLTGINIILQKWEHANIDREIFQYVHDWGRWFDAQPNRRMPDGSWCNPGFADYNDLIRRINQPIQYMNRLARWPCEEAQIKATFEQLPYLEQEIDRYVEPMPYKL